MSENLSSSEGLVNPEEITNKDTIVCQYCPSKILKPGFGTLTHEEFSLPVMRPKKDGDTSESESLTDFWSISDMFHFENIGVSKDVGDIKYLICADCEIGPIGWHNKTTKLNYISLSRVKTTSD